MPVSSAFAALMAAAMVTVSLGATSAAGREQPDTHEAMDRMVRAEEIPGVLGATADGGKTWRGGSGAADLGTDRPRRPADRFRIGSLTKTFVATVLLQLEAEGALRLDDTVEQWLPGTVSSHGNDGSRITVRQLLRHTSGIPDFTDDPAIVRDYLGRGFLDHRWSAHDPEELVRRAVARPPDFGPGTGWRYSNTNYVLAGMIVQRVTGHSYAHEIEHRIVRPLHLKATSLPGSSPEIPGPTGRAYSTLFASPSSADAGPWDVTAFNPSLAGASGEMISSAGDLVRFFRALLSGRLLPEAQQREMRRTVTALEPDDRYGLGLARHTLSCGTRVWGHEGTIHGSRSLAVGTADGTHVAAFNVNADWAGDPLDLVEAEFCGTLAPVSPE